MVHDIGYDIIDKVRIIKIMIITTLFIFGINESVIAIFGGLHGTTY